LPLDAVLAVILFEQLDPAELEDTIVNPLLKAPMEC
jgi:hypothetical protein